MAESPDAQDLVARLDRIQKLTSQLATVQVDLIKQQALAERIARELEALRLALQLVEPED